MRALYYTPQGTTQELPDSTQGDGKSLDTTKTTIRKHGSGLVLDTAFPTPQPSTHQYLLKVTAAAFCHDEIRLASALNPHKTTPQIPLHSLCGTVISTPAEDMHRDEGPRFRIGDAVFGLLSYTRDGGAADYAVACEDELALKPANITAAEAAALALPALTAWQALFRYAGLDPDVPGGLDEDGDAGGNGTGRWTWHESRRETLASDPVYGFGKFTGHGSGVRDGNAVGGDGRNEFHRSVVDSNHNEQRGSLGGDLAGGGGGSTSGTQANTAVEGENGRWVWHWNRRGTILARNGAKDDPMPPAPGSVYGAASGADYGRVGSTQPRNPDMQRRKTLQNLTSSNARRGSLFSLMNGHRESQSANHNGNANGTKRRHTLLDLIHSNGNRNGQSRGSIVRSISGSINATRQNQDPSIRILVTNARDNEVGRIAVQLLRAKPLFPPTVRPWICVTCTEAEEAIITQEWDVDGVIVIPHLPLPAECDIGGTFKRQRWLPVDIVLDCTGGEVFRQVHASRVIKNYGAVMTVVEARSADQPLGRAERDILGHRKRGIKTRFVPPNPDGDAMARIVNLVENNLVRGREDTVVDLERAVDLLAGKAAGTAGSRRGEMMVVRLDTGPARRTPGSPRIIPGKSPLAAPGLNPMRTSRSLGSSPRQISVNV
jgi:NADPH:quinone reductase-like Zn-dependent oxidoreductase